MKPWPFNRTRYKPHNPAPTSDQFASSGGFEMFQVLMDLWHRVGRLEGRQTIILIIQAVLLGAVAGRVFNLF